jgi:hypothetical protein
MNQPTNPFTQLPLEVSQLVEQPDLKAAIAAWFATWKAQRQARASTAAAVYHPASTPDNVSDP